MTDAQPSPQPLGPSAPGALDGVRVLDLSRVLAGPVCTMALGDLGADVIKVEHPERGDDTRSWGPPFAGGESAYYLSCNRSKRGIAVDFQTDAGKQVVRDLAARSDVLVENFRPGTLDRLGLGYEPLSRLNPRLIYCGISAFGTVGPDKDRPGLDVIVAATGGLMSITGEPDGPPVKPGVALIDVATALYAFGAINAALYQRQSTGRGQKLELSLMGVELMSLINIASSYLVAGVEPRPWGSAHPAIVPYQAIEAADGYLVVGATNDQLWRRFCAAVGLDQMANDPRYATNQQRVAHRDEVIGAIERLMRTRPRAEWVEILNRAGVPCGAVNTVPEAFSDPQVPFLGMVQEVPHPTIGTVRLTGVPVRFSASSAAVRRHPPLLGEHTVEVLRDELGYDQHRVDQLLAERVVRQWQPESAGQS